MRDDFAIFILTHGRAENIVTLRTLKRSGYTGKVYLLIDDEDEQGDLYRELYGEENVIEFSKKEIAKKIDVADNFEGRSAIVYARNAVYDVAKNLGLKYFLQFDDDYNFLNYRRVEKGKLKAYEVKSFDVVIDVMIDFLEVSGAKTVCFNQGGDLIGGTNSKNWKEGITRKAMNSFFCKTDRRIWFKGKLNEDVTTYVLDGSRGDLFFSFAGVMIGQLPTQTLKGGITESYKEQGTYVKSFYTILHAPSAVKISTIGNTNTRVHHHVNWKNTCPKIVSEEWKK